MSYTWKGLDVNKYESLKLAVDIEQIELVRYLLEQGYHKQAIWYSEYQEFSVNKIFYRYEYDNSGDFYIPFVIETNNDDIDKLLEEYL